MARKRDPSLIPLSHDHHHGLVRVFEIRQALRSGQGLEAQVELTRAFYRDELTAHFRAEEEIVFPAIGAATDAATATLADLIAEHRRLGEMVDSLDASTQGFAAFADLLERHIRREERELFVSYEKHVAPPARAAVEEGVRRILDRPDDTPRSCALPSDSATS